MTAALGAVPDTPVGSYSIVRRLTMVVVLLSLGLLAVNVWVFVQALQPMGDNLADSYVEQLVSLRQALAQVPPAQRPAMAAALSRVEARLEPQPGQGLPDAAPPPDPLSRVLAERLAQRLPAQAVVTRQPTDEDAANAEPAHLRMSFLLDGQRWGLQLPVRRPPLLWPLLPSLILLGLVAGIGALVAITSVRIITRPVADISQRLAERQQQLRPIDAHPAMGRELLQIVGAFNGMAAAMASAQATRRQMLAGLSHDLRTPLTRLRLRVECECAPEAIESMEKDFDALARIIDQFLAFTQGEAGVSLGRPEAVSELARHVHRRYQDRGCEVRLEMDDGAAALCTLPDLAVLRILTNLVDNALAHGQGPVVLRVTSAATHCELAVADQGAGMNAAAFAAARQPFVKLARRERELGHCGLGLAIVDQIAQQLGGVLWHRQQPGAGCATGVRIPLAAAAGDAPAVHWG